MTAVVPLRPAPPPRRNFWQRWALDPVRRQLTQGVTPEKIALSIAVGSALALFPILGTTTTLCVVAGIVLGLNQPILQGVNALCTFVYFPLLLAFVRLGDVLTGSAPSTLNIRLMISTFTHHPRAFFQQFGLTAVHAMLGWVVLAPGWVAAVYVALLLPLRAARRTMKAG